MEYKILEKMFEGENPKSVFEIGVGGGGLLKDVSDHFGCTDVGGIDISRVRMQNLTNTFPGKEFLVHDLNDPWPVPDNSFDIVFSVGVLMYIFEPIPVIQEMLRVAKDKIILAEYHTEDVDEYGGLAKIKLPDRMSTGIGRNYIKLFETLGKNITTEPCEGKTIIKCLK